MKWLRIVVILILLVIGFFSFGIIQPYSCSFSMHGGPYGMMGFGYGGIIMWTIFLVIISLVVYLILRNTGFRGFEISDRETSLDILKRRYAQGEITKEEFDNMKKDL